MAPSTPYPAPHPAFTISHHQGDDYATWLIQEKAGELVGHFGFTESDREDIEQELALELVEQWPKFDPKRSRPQTFAARVIAGKVSKLIRYELAESRHFERVGCSLETGDEEEVTTCFRTGQPRRIEQEFVDLRHDVAVVLARLPPELRDLAKRLQCESRAAVSRQTGIPESTLRYRIKTIRRYFKAACLDDYL